ncbi:MAG: response regulator [Lachnospiraceae bacterium]|nr:response regulator [Lachnospiraceae bacterium]
MTSGKRLENKYKMKKSSFYLLGQIFLCVIIVTIIILFGNKIYYDDLNEVKQLRLDSEVKKMKEIVTNTIIHIDLHRECMQKNVTQIIASCTADAEVNRYTDPVCGVKRVLELFYGSAKGNVVQAIIEDGSRCILLNEQNRDGILLGDDEKETMLSREVIRDIVVAEECTIHFFAFQSDIDDLVKAEEYRHIHSMQYTEDSYVWVNEVVNMEGGDNYAIRRIHPNLILTEGEYLSTSTQDIKGNYPYAEELNGIREDGEVVHQYFFKNKSNDEIAEKISYGAFYEPYCWIVATGTPLEDLYSDISHRSVERLNTLSIQMGIVCILVSFFMLISVRKIIARLSKATLSAETANRAKSVFLFNMSHDIRTPMNAIIGFTKIARNNLEDREKVGDALSKIEDSGKVLLNLIDDVLELARIESGKMELNCIPVSLRDGVTGVREIFDEEMAQKGIHFSSEVQVENDSVMCDCLKMNRICFNLLSNALKFTPAGGRVELTIHQVSGVRKDGTAEYELRVKDNGIGMSEEFQKHLFEMFERERTSTVSRLQGTGLGLAIVKQIVSFLGGTIQVISRQGEGTEFIIRLSMESVAGEQTQKETNCLREEKPNLAGKRILLVEDNELNREIASELLDNEGVEVETAEDGSVALSKLMNSTPGYFDLIIMDIQMPVMDGYTATQEIRQLPDERLANIPIVAMTANAFDEDKKKAFDVGMDGYIAKPIDVPELMEILAQILGEC